MTITCGYERKSDCVVTVMLTDGDIDIEIYSKIEKLFGNQMRNAVKGGAEDLGVKGAKIIVNDFGALDFVIKARTKTALREAMSRRG
ncbi:hypothetical protein SANA_13880 [Gottschalkiaceae bacterium SANA]|nr:hypothetical protein SANA_13880 [Gottschalkiaceae bacterium SANA]